MEHITESGNKMYIDENKITYNSIEEYRTQPLQYQREPRRNKRLLDSTSSPPKNENKKKNIQNNDQNLIFSEGTESQPVSVLRELFENQNVDTSTNTDMTTLDTEKTDSLTRNERNEKMEKDNDDLFFTQPPDNPSYISDELRTQNVPSEYLQSDSEGTPMEVEKGCLS